MKAPWGPTDSRKRQHTEVANHDVQGCSIKVSIDVFGKISRHSKALCLMIQSTTAGTYELFMEPSLVQPKLVQMCADVCSEISEITELNFCYAARQPVRCYSPGRQCITTQQ